MKKTKDYNKNYKFPGNKDDKNNYRISRSYIFLKPNDVIIRTIKDYYENNMTVLVIESKPSKYKE